MVPKEVKATNAVLFNVGAFNGGTANNIVCDHCSMYCTLRTHEASDAELIIGKIKRVIQNIADVSGGRAEYVQDKHYPTVINDPHIAELMKKSAEKIIGEGNVITNAPRGLGGEDFSYMLNEKPGCMLDLGVRNEELGYTAGLHKDNFMIDESALSVGSDIFVQFVLDNMNGI
jgi:amidohydrolase